MVTTYSPEDAVSERHGGVVVEFDVSPNATETRVPSGFDEWRGCFRARVSEPPRGGEANQELVEMVEELFGVEARLVSGEGSSRKSVWLRKDLGEVLWILENEITD